MSAPSLPPLLLQFIDDEMLRAPLFIDQVIEGSALALRQGLPSLMPGERALSAELIERLNTHRRRVNEQYVQALRSRIREDLDGQFEAVAKPTDGPLSLALVDEDEVAVDVEIANITYAVRDICEYELRELATYTSALFGDMDVSRENNPFRAENQARALGSAASALALPLAQQAQWLHHAAPVAAQLLRKAYAAAASRLEGWGVQPAAYRTVILPSGARSRGRYGETTFSPELHRIRDSIHAPLDPLATSVPKAPPPSASVSPSQALPTTLPPWQQVLKGARLDRIQQQSAELVGQLFSAMLEDERVPRDCARLLQLAHRPALFLAAQDATLLDQDQHPLWRLVNRLVYEAQMVPNKGDPERLQLLRLVKGGLEQLAAEPAPTTRHVAWVLQQLDAFLSQRLTRRVARAGGQIAALQRLEDKLCAGQASPSTFAGALDVAQLDTVPADLLDAGALAPAADGDAEAWLRSLQPGDWVRLFLQGRWVHAALLWPGERQEVYLLGDGASDATWAVRRRALLMMHGTRLAKKLKQRNIVGSAARRVHERLSQQMQQPA